MDGETGIGVGLPNGNLDSQCGFSVGGGTGLSGVVDVVSGVGKSMAGVSAVVVGVDTTGLTEWCMAASRVDTDFAGEFALLSENTSILTGVDAGLTEGFASGLTCIGVDAGLTEGFAIAASRVEIGLVGKSSKFVGVDREFNGLSEDSVETDSLLILPYRIFEMSGCHLGCFRNLQNVEVSSKDSMTCRLSTRVFSRALSKDIIVNFCNSSMLFSNSKSLSS